MDDQEPGMVPDPSLGIPADEVDAPLDPPEDDADQDEPTEINDDEDEEDA